MITQEQFKTDFEDFVKSLKDILFKKNNDYTGNNSDPFFNLRRAERIGLPAWKGTLIRLLDKMARLETFASKQEFKVDGENFEDTIKDAANYLFLVLELYKEQYDKSQINQSTKNSNRHSDINRE